MSFVQRYVIFVFSLFVKVGSILKDVNSLEKMFFVISIWIFVGTFPEFTFVSVCVFISNPEESSSEVIPFFSPRYKVPSIVFSPFSV